MNITIDMTCFYMISPRSTGPKNKPNSNPIKPIQTQFKPKQTQFKPNQSQFVERGKNESFCVDKELYDEIL
ncbi:MAG: hypothetical protein FVQ84_04020 [Planctomycetes bacterium]|nr:hypothetical protein [Planctomycetota bacterium]